MNRFMLALVAHTLVAAMSTVHAADLAAGKIVFEKFNCASCHGAEGRTALSPAYPVLAGQYADYLRHTLKAYKRGAAGSPPSANVRTNPIMSAFALPLTDEDIKNVAAWLAAQPSELGVRQ